MDNVTKDEMGQPHPQEAMAGLVEHVEQIEAIKKELKEQKKAFNMAVAMMGVLIVALLIAIVPQLWYELYLEMNPGFELSWQMRDRFLLFSFTSHLTIILITVAGLVIFIKQAKLVDYFQALMDSSAQSAKQITSKFKSLGYDIDSFTPAKERALATYHARKTEFEEGMVMFEDFLKLVPSLKELYGERLHNMANASKETQKELLKDLIEKPPTLKQ